MAKRYWLMKTEPDELSISDLKAKPGKTEAWNGVRNYQARNNMRDGMSVGDEVLFYHSSVTPAGVAGLATIARKAYPDPTALDPKSHYHDPKAKPDRNPWVMVDVKFKREFARLITLDEMRRTPGLEKMLVIKKGMRLSVQPVTPEEFAIVVKLAGA
jgi:predicted RNA-binding protein with PUA-like domain